MQELYKIPIFTYHIVNIKGGRQKSAGKHPITFTYHIVNIKVIIKQVCYNVIIIYISHS